MPAPLQIYLDSSDFSVLSDPGQLSSPALVELRSQLFKWKTTREVDFIYSAVHVVEAAAVETQHTNKAKERAELIYELCDQNVFVPFTDILKNESLALAGRHSDCNFFRKDGRWFAHDLTSCTFSGASRLTIESLKSNIQKMGSGKWDRVKRDPALQKQLLAAARDHLNRGRESTIAELMCTFSIEYADADFLNQFSLGLKSHEELSAFMDVRLRDPSFLIQMRPANYNGMNSLFDWMRNNAKSFYEVVCEVADYLQRMCERADDGEVAAKMIAKSSSGEGLQNLAIQLYERLARGVLTQTEVDAIDKRTFDDFIKLAPGSYTFSSVAVDSIFRSFVKSPRRPKPSDMVDMFHSFYAPYVDVYRTDGFMAPITEKYVKKFDTTVVGKLSDLIPTVQAILATRS
jgi:hypothetical protein